MDIASQYRPSDFDAVLGQGAVIKSLRSKLKNGKVPHAMLFQGPSGVGKTTVARIIASGLGVNAGQLVEVDAATYSGADAMRELCKQMFYRGMGVTTSNRVMILDECHALSKQAWNVLLKPLEDSPATAYFIFCTTELGKVPATIKTRCTTYGFEPVPDDLIVNLLTEVNGCEGLISEKVQAEAFDLIVDQSGGSPRQALTLLSACAGLKSIDDIQHALKASPHDSKEAIDLCRALMSGAGFAECIAIVQKMAETNTAESIRIIVSHYFASVIMKSGGKGKMIDRALHILGCFDRPYDQSTKWAPLMLSLGDVFAD